MDIRMDGLVGPGLPAHLRLELRELKRVCTTFEGGSHTARTGRDACGVRYLYASFSPSGARVCLASAPPPCVGVFTYIHR